jgi:RNA polymerase sigma-70 factor, ECF subfamily
MTKVFLKNYKIYKDKIYNYFWYRLDFNQAIAEDMTQEVFLKAFDKFDTFDRDKPFQSWIYMIAKNHLKNYYRVQGREVGYKDYESRLTTDTVTMIDIKMEWEQVLEKIKALPNKYSEVLLLRYVDGLSNDEISELLCVEKGAIRTRISRALKIIKETSEDNEKY